MDADNIKINIKISSARPRRRFHLSTRFQKICVIIDTEAI